MPTYVYACRECDDRLEVVQKMSDAPLTTCEKCRGSLRRVLFAPAVVYKGSGFYTTDYKNGGRNGATNGAEKAEKSESASTAEKSETKTESKTESKAETKSESKAETTAAA